MNLDIMLTENEAILLNNSLYKSLELKTNTEWLMCWTCFKKIKNNCS